MRGKYTCRMNNQTELLPHLEEERSQSMFNSLFIIAAIITIGTGAFTDVDYTMPVNCTTAHGRTWPEGVELPHRFNAVLSYHLQTSLAGKDITFYSLDVSRGTVRKWASTVPITSIILQTHTGACRARTYSPPVMSDDSPMVVWSSDGNGIHSVSACFD